MVTANIKLIDEEELLYNITLESDEPTKPIAGHRYVDLLGLNPFANNTSMLLDFYGIKYVPQNDYMKLGSLLEDYLIDYCYGNCGTVLRFKYEDYKECKSGAFDLDDEDIGGLPDGIVVDNGILIEVKCTTRLFQGFKEEWVEQARFYAYWWNKHKAIETGIEIKEIHLLKYYVPKSLLKAQIKEPSWIVDKNIHIGVFDLDTENTENNIMIARNMKKELIENSSFTMTYDGNKDLFCQLKKAHNMKKIKFEYDRDNRREKMFVRKIYKTKLKSTTSKKRKKAIKVR